MSLSFNNFDNEEYKWDYSVTKFIQLKYYFLFPILHPNLYKKVKILRHNIGQYKTGRNKILQDLISKHSLIFSYDELVAVKSKNNFTKKETRFIDYYYSERINMLEIVEKIGNRDYLICNIQ